MKRFLIPATAAAAILVGVSAGNAAECVNGFLDLKNNDNIPCTMSGADFAALSPDYAGAPAGTVMEDAGPATTGTIQPDMTGARAPVPVMANEPTSRADCQPGGYFLMPEPGGGGTGTILMACPGS